MAPIAPVIGVLLAAGTTGCGGLCIDDGFLGADCAAAGTSFGGTVADGDTGPDPDGPVTLDGTSQTATMSGSHSGTSFEVTSLDGTATLGTDTEGTTDSESTTDTTATTATTDDTTASESSGTTGNPLQPFCLDADGDGVPDLDACVDADPDDPPPDHVPPGPVDDCDDADGDVFPGAAANEPELCTIDADGDGWGDWDAPAHNPLAEEGSDCDDVDPLVERCALLVTQTGTATAPLDAPLVPALQDLGLTVLLAEDVLTVAADADPTVLVVISETATAADVAAEFRDVDEGVIVMEGAIWDDMDIAPAGVAMGDVELQILDDTHPIAAGHSGTVAFMQDNPGSGILRTSPGPGAQLIAARVPNPAHVVVFAFETGVAMENGLLAPGRRVGFGADVDGGMGPNGQLGADGLAMFTAAASWAID